MGTLSQELFVATGPLYPCPGQFSPARLSLPSAPFGESENLSKRSPESRPGLREGVAKRWHLDGRGWQEQIAKIVKTSPFR